jgi:hypothetical protein
MGISAEQFVTIEELADLLYEFLPASGNSTTAFPLAAKQADVKELWTLESSKRPAIVDLLAKVIARRRERLPSLMLCIVQQSMVWRKKKGNPLTRAEVDRLNELVLALGFRVKAVVDPSFLSKLPGSPAPAAKPAETESTPAADLLLSLRSDLLAFANLDPQPRGYKFETWLNRLFDAYKLAPRPSFRLVGEQIDGSFHFDGAPYLLEARWKNERSSIQELLAFSGKVDGKAVWARGLFISYTGFTEDGLTAFERGRRTNLVGIDGLDLHEMLARGVSFPELLSKKLRIAGETNRAFVPFRDLYH